MTAPDPQTVREIARDCAADYLDDARDIAAHVMGHFGMGVPGDVYAWTDAVRADLSAAVVSWPDEQQPAEATVSEQAQDGGTDDSFAMVAEDAPTGAARAVAEYWRDYAAAVSNGGRFTDWAQIAQVATWILAAMDAEAEQTQDGAAELTLTAIRCRALTASTYAEWHQVARDVETLAEQLARANDLTEKLRRARAELHLERDALAARVAELEAEREADTRAVARCQRAKAGPDAAPAMLALDARFADRIDTLAARDTKDGE